MQSSQKWIISFILIVLVGVGTFSYTNPELFQGRMTSLRDKTATTYASLDAKSSKVTITSINLKDLSLTATDDPENPMDAYDQSWVTVGYWDMSMEKGYSTCSDGSLSFGFATSTDTFPLAFGGIAQETRLVVRDSSGKTLDTVEPGVTLSDFTLPQIYSGKLQLQLDMRPEDLATIPGPSYENTALKIYLGQACIQGTDSAKYYYDKKDQLSQNKYFTVSKETKEFGVQGGEVTFKE